MTHNKLQYSAITIYYARSLLIIGDNEDYPHNRS